MVVNEFNTLKEKFADLCHRQWSHWMRYMASKSKVIKNSGDYRLEEGDVVIPSQLMERWARQVATEYTDLSEEEKDSDREMANQFIKTLSNHYSELYNPSDAKGT